MHRKLAVSAALSAGLSAVPAASAALISPGITNPANGHTYYLTGQGPWTNAAMEAIESGGQLVTVNDAAEQAWVFATFGGYGGTARLLWTGLNDAAVNGQFRYLSGQTPAYTNWAAGEPNGGAAERYVAMFYPGHNSAGRWNDWGQGLFVDPIGVPFHGVVEVDPAAGRPTVLARTDASWLALTPVGSQAGQPIGSVGLAWEAAHPGWRSDPGYDTAGWSAAAGGPTVWAAGGASPAYLRKTFALSAVPAHVTLLATVDDDAMVYVNGTLVAGDADGTSSELMAVDVAPYLRAGENLIAVKAQNAGGAEGFRLLAYDPVPEPGAVGLVAAAAAAGLLRRRQRPRRR